MFERNHLRSNIGSSASTFRPQTMSKSVNKQSPKDKPARGADDNQLRYGWTTGACATAATKAAYTALLTGDFPNPVTIRLPKGQMPSFDLAKSETGDGWALAGVVKDAGDDPDVTHGALIVVKVRHSPSGSGVKFFAGKGVGTITKPGLPIPPGEPAINPVPRQMMGDVISEVARACNAEGDATIEISVPGGEKIARRTWNPRLGIEGGLSILGTTGIVVPYSCSAWIHSIHRGIDVARALGTPHVAACVGSTSERLVKSLYDLPETAYIDMGDFVGGLLKYLRRHPLPRISIAGGFAKMSKLANGATDLHSNRSQISREFLADLIENRGGHTRGLAKVRKANTALEILQLAQSNRLPIGQAVAEQAHKIVGRQLRGASISVEVLVADREGRLIGRANEDDLRKC